MRNAFYFVFTVAKDVRAVLMFLLDLQTDPTDVDEMFQTTTKDPQVCGV